MRVSVKNYLKYFLILLIFFNINLLSAVSVKLERVENETNSFIEHNLGKNSRGIDEPLKPGKSEYFNLTLPEKNSYGAYKKYVKGIGEISEDKDKKNKTRLENPGEMIKLEKDFKGKGVVWLQSPVDQDLSLVFWGRTEGDLEVVLGFGQDDQWLVKVILGPNDSKIITRQEYEEEEKEKTFLETFDTDGRAFIRSNEIVTFKNVDSGKYIERTTTGESVALGTDPSYIGEQYKINYDDDNVFLYNNSDIFLKSMFDGQFLTVAFGVVGGFRSEPQLERHNVWISVFNLQRVSDGKDSRIKDGDIVRLGVNREDSNNPYLVAEYVFGNFNGLLANRYDAPYAHAFGGSPYNKWQINLIDPKYKNYDAKKYQKKVLNYPRVTALQFPGSVSTSGLNGKYWISLSKDSIMVGSGYQPGKNLFLYRKLSKDLFDKLNYIGFSCNGDTAQISNLFFTPPLSVVDLLTPYETENYETKDYAKFSTVENNKPYYLRSMHKGAFRFMMSEKENVKIALCSADKTEYTRYTISLDAKQIKIYKKINEEDQLMSSGEIITNNPGRPDGFIKYRIDINDGLFLVLKDKELVYAWYDCNAKQDDQIGCVKFLTQVPIKDLKIYSPLKLSYQVKDAYKKETKDWTENLQDFKIIFPFYYAFYNKTEGSPTLNIEDRVFDSGPIPVFKIDQNKENSVLLRIESTGKPVFETNMEAETWASKIGDVFIGTVVDTGKAMTEIDDPTTKAIGLGVTAVGSLGKNLKEMIMSSPEKIYTQEFKVLSALVEQNDIIEKYNTEIQELISEYLENKDSSLNIDPFKGVNNIKAGIDVCLRIFDRIKSSGNVTEQRKNLLLRFLKKLFNAALKQEKNSIEFDQDLLNLLFNIYNNPFFLNPKDKSDLDALAEIWKNANLVARKMFINLKEQEIESLELPACFGNAIYYPTDLYKFSDKGIVVVEASGKGTFVMGLNYQDVNIVKYDQASEIYMLAVGGWGNTMSAFCLSSDFLPEVSVSAQQNAQAMMLSLGYRKYCLIYDLIKGLFIYGIMEEDEDGKKSFKEVLRLEDHYPMTEMKYLFLSTYESLISIKNISVYKDLSEALGVKTQEFSKISSKVTQPVSTESLPTEPAADTSSVFDKLKAYLQKKK